MLVEWRYLVQPERSLCLHHAETKTQNLILVFDYLDFYWKRLPARARSTWVLGALVVSPRVRRTLFYQKNESHNKLLWTLIFNLFISL